MARYSRRSRRGTPRRGKGRKSSMKRKIRNYTVSRGGIRL